MKTGITNKWNKKKRILDLSSAFVKMSFEVTLTAKKVLRTIPPRLFAQPQQLSTNFYGKPNLLQTKFKWFQTQLQNYDAHTNTSSKHLLLS